MIRFIVDECTGPIVAKWLSLKGFDAYSVAEVSPGITDEEVLNKAVLEERILITNDKDFGELIYKNHLPHKGIIFLRLMDESSKNKIDVLDKLFKSQIDILSNHYFLLLLLKKQLESIIYKIALGNQH